MSRFAPLLIVLAVGCRPASPPPPEAASPPSEPSRPSGAWLGQDPPGTTPALFSPGFVSTAASERDLAWTPDGRQVFWTLYSPRDRHGTVVTSRRNGSGAWSDPEILPIFRGHNSLEPFVTGDGEWLWFASKRPLPGEEEAGDWNLWRSRRSDAGWAEPEALPEPVNLEGDEYYPSLTRDGDLVFTATRESSLGGEDLYRIAPDGDGWGDAENLGPNVNSPGPEFNSLIHPDGDWILFGSAREGDAGGGDLYLARADGAGGWTPAEALAPPLSSPALDFCPSLSPDGTILFFTSQRSAVDPGTVEGWSELAERLASPENGQGDLYWVDASVLGPSTEADG